MRRGPIRLLAALLAAPLLALAGCGEEAPADASTDAFCDAFGRLHDAEHGKDFRDFGDRLDEVGTPAGISDQARDGFEVAIRVAGDVEPDATLDELVDPGVSNEEARNLEEFISYARETCRGGQEAGDLGP